MILTPEYYFLLLCIADVDDGYGVIDTCAANPMRMRDIVSNRQSANILHFSHPLISKNFQPVYSNVYSTSSDVFRQPRRQNLLSLLHSLSLSLSLSAFFSLFCRYQKCDQIAKRPSLLFAPHPPSRQWTLLLYHNISIPQHRLRAVISRESGSSVTGN